MFRFFFFLFILLIFNFAFGQNLNLPGTPLVKNFTKEETKNKSKIYKISQGDNGITYFATPSGLLEFDGISWNKYSFKEESELHAVYFKDNNHIYTAGHGGFGYWFRNKFGELEYVSLFFKEPKKDDALLPLFSSIQEWNGNILFQTFQQIFIYNPKSNSLNSIGALKGFDRLFSSQGRVFVQDVEIGLFELKGSERILLEGTKGIKLSIVNVFVKNNNELLLITKNNGAWLLKNNALIKKEWKFNEVLEKYLVNEVVQFEKDKLLIATLRNGFYIVSLDGTILNHINKANGLQNNTVRTVFSDMNNNIWLGTENGISYVEVSGDTNYFLDRDGSFGTVYTSYLKDSLLYMGTNQGLFVKNINNKATGPILLDKSLDQIWVIDEINNQILVGGHRGVSKLINKKLQTIHIEGGAWVFKKHPEIDDILYVGFYSGICVFKKISGEYVFQKKLEGYGESSRFIEFDNFGQLWVSHPQKGYYRLQLSSDGMDIKEFEFYGKNKNSIEPYAYLCKIDGNLVFYNQKGYFNYDPIDNTFIKNKYLTELFKGLDNLNSISQFGNIFWFSTTESIGYVERKGNEFFYNQDSFYNIADNHLNDFNKFIRFNNSIFGFGISDGMAFHQLTSTKPDSIIRLPIIRSVNFIGAKSIMPVMINPSEAIDVPFSNNYVSFSIAMPMVPMGNHRKVEYMLKGLNEKWSSWDYKSDLNFPGLASGSYELQLRSYSDNGQISNVISFPFYVTPPWYLNRLAIAFYCLILFVVLIMYRGFLQRRNSKKTALLIREEEQKRKQQQDKFEREKLEREKDLLLLKEENLNLEIQNKNSELASSTLNNIKKNELLNDLITEISDIDKNLLNTSLHAPVKKLVKKINSHLGDNEDWLTFELHFRNAHALFFEKLREKHPDLSTNEIKLSAYLKLNLSSKEIAALMNISIKSVEQSRYRLRKKLELNKDVVLVNYLQSF